jgi:hypothetical protein
VATIRFRSACAVTTLVGLASLLAPAGAAADDPPGQLAPEATLEAAQQALEPGAAPDSIDPQQLAAASVATADPSLALRDLALAMPRLEGPDRRRAKALLARPTDARDRLGDSYGAPEAEPFCSAHFCVHYVTTTKDAPSLTDVGGVPGVPDYVEKIDVAAETSYAVENDQLGWRPPKPDGNLGGNSLTDIYLVNVGGRSLFGYSAPDPPPEQRCVRTCFAYLVMDNDFSEGEFGYPDPQIPLEVTIAHEYNHVLQFRVDARTDGWLFESTAVWSEDRVFPNDNDYVSSYLRTFASTPQVSITNFAGAHGLRIYGLATFDHFLDRVRGYGPGVILAAAMDKSIRNHDGPGFGVEFTQFAAATAEWRSLGFPDATLYPNVNRKGKLGKSKHGKRITLDHMAYRLFNVSPQGGSKLTLTVSSGEVRAGLALVGRDASGRVVTKARFLKKGGHGSVTLASPGDFDRITAVVVNGDYRVSGFDQIRRDWNYTRDNAKLKARLAG